MSSVILILTFCLLADPAQCKPEIPQSSEESEGMTSMGCLVSAQQLAAQYEEDHPGWVLADKIRSDIHGIKCQIGVQGTQRIERHI
jgi:hypothetical protein